MGDLISRQAAIEVLRNRWLKTRNYEGIGEDIAEECEIYLKTLPSAQPTVDAVPVRHGKYIGTEFDGYADGCPVYYEWKCSECGCVFEEEEPTYNYCPNCGTKMDGETKEKP